MGLRGWEALARLAELGVDMEMADERGVVAIGTVYDRAEDYAALTDAFARLRPGAGKTARLPGNGLWRPRHAAAGGGAGQNAPRAA